MIGGRMKPMNEREPLAIRGAVVAAVVAIIQVAVVFGWNLTTDQFAALAVAINLIGTAVVVVWSRGKVTPVDDPRLPSE
jgi:hypothetical protein